jgi:hypothetical protein
MASPSLESLLSTLASSDVEFIVVGLLAAVAQGAPVTTHDLDIVHRRTPENVARLVDVLVNRLDARYRSRADVLRPTVEILAGPGYSLLQTSAGPLDVHGAIQGGRDYDALLPSSRRIEISRHPVYVLDLATLRQLPHVVIRVVRHEAARHDVEVARDALGDLAGGVGIAELPVVLGDRLVAPRQHELVTEREAMVAPPQREPYAQAAIR